MQHLTGAALTTAAGAAGAAVTGAAVTGAAVAAGGWRTVVYGSQATVGGNPPLDGYVIAEWDGMATVPGTPHAVGHQYASLAAYDLDVFTAAILPLWQPHQTGPQPQPPQPQPSKESPVRVYRAISDQTTGHNIAAGYQCLVTDLGGVTWIPHLSDVTPLVAAYGPAIEVSGDLIYNLITRKAL